MLFRKILVQYCWDLIYSNLFFFGPVLSFFALQFLSNKDRIFYEHSILGFLSYVYFINCTHKINFSSLMSLHHLSMFNYLKIIIKRLQKQN